MIWSGRNTARISASSASNTAGVNFAGRVAPGIGVPTSLLVRFITSGTWDGWARDQAATVSRQAARVMQLVVKSMSRTWTTLKPGVVIAAM